MARPFKVGRLRHISLKLYCSNHLKEGAISQGKKTKFEEKYKTIALNFR